MSLPAYTRFDYSSRYDPDDHRKFSVKSIEKKLTKSEFDDFIAGLLVHKVMVVKGDETAFFLNGRECSYKIQFASQIYACNFHDYYSVEGRQFQTYLDSTIVGDLERSMEAQR